MTVRFEQNSYLNCVKKEISFHSEEMIRNYAKIHPKFSYGNARFSDFKNEYRTGNAFEKKIIALPAAAYVGVVKTIYHLAHAIFKGILARSNNGIHFKKNFYSAGRDLQESYGWLVTIIDTQLGQFYVQESHFHKSCYSCFDATISSSDPSNFSPTHHPVIKTNYSSNSSSFNSTPAPVTPLKSTSKRPINPSLNTEKRIPPKDSRTNSIQTALDNEFVQIGKLHNFNEKDKAYTELAEKYLKNGYLEKAYEAATTMYSTSVSRDPVLEKIANAYLDKNDKKNAYKIVSCIFRNSPEKEVFIIKIANAYFSEGDFENALKTINAVIFSTENKTTFVLKVANAYLDNGNAEKALKVIDNHCMDSAVKGAFLKKVADAHFNAGNYNKALTTIQKISLDTDLKDHFIHQVALAYLKKGDKEQAVKTIDLMTLNSNTKDSFLEKLATIYFDEGSIKMALESIVKTTFFNQAKEKFIIKIAKHQLSNNEGDNAFSTLKLIKNISPSKNQMIIEMAYSYDDPSKIIDMISEIISSSIQWTFIKNKQTKKYTQIIIDNEKTNKANLFIRDLATLCYENAKEDFHQKNTQKILEIIVRTATSDSTINDFSKL